MGLNEIIQIGTRIRKLRLEKGINQKQMATLIGIPYSTYSNYENNNREPNIEILQKIADVFNMTLDELIEYKSIASSRPNYIKFTSIQEFKNFNTFLEQYKGDEYTSEDLEKIKEYAEFLKSQRNKPKN